MPESANLEQKRLKIMVIKSKDNPKIKQLAKLISSKKERLNSSCFVIEGIKLLGEALAENAEVLSVFASSSAIEKYSSVLTLAQNACEFYEITDDIAKKVSDAKSPQGVFAIVTSTYNCIEALDDTNDKILVLNNISDPGNLGTLLRTADAVGISSVVLCENCCEVYNPKVVRSTMGSIFRLKIICEESFKSVSDWFKANGVKSFAAVVNMQAESLTQIEFPKRCAIVIGNEGNGLSERDVSLCDRRITIEMKGDTESLNASVAAAIIMWEMTK